MTDEVEIRPTGTPGPRAPGRWAGNGRPRKEHRPQGSAGTWAPSRAHHSPPKEPASLAILLHRLDKAAAAHDRGTAAETFGESA